MTGPLVGVRIVMMGGLRPGAVLRDVARRPRRRPGARRPGRRGRRPARDRPRPAPRPALGRDRRARRPWARSRARARRGRRCVRRRVPTRRGGAARDRSRRPARGESAPRVRAHDRIRPGRSRTRPWPATTSTTSRSAARSTRSVPTTRRFRRSTSSAITAAAACCSRSGCSAGSSRRASRAIGQVLDVAMIDGAATLMAVFYGLFAEGRWEDRRHANLLDGAAHYYRTYETADGKHFAVGSMEPQFYAELCAGLGVDLPQDNDAESWAAHGETMAARFREKTRDEWEAELVTPQSCAVPVFGARRSAASSAPSGSRLVPRPRRCPAAGTRAAVLAHRAADAERRPRCRVITRSRCSPSWASTTTPCATSLPPTSSGRRHEEPGCAVRRVRARPAVGFVRGRRLAGARGRHPRDRRRPRGRRRGRRRRSGSHPRRRGHRGVDATSRSRTSSVPTDPRRRATKPPVGSTVAARLGASGAVVATGPARRSRCRRAPTPRAARGSKRPRRSPSSVAFACSWNRCTRSCATGRTCTRSRTGSRSSTACREPASCSTSGTSGGSATSTRSIRAHVERDRPRAGDQHRSRRARGGPLRPGAAAERRRRARGRASSRRSRPLATGVGTRTRRSPESRATSASPSSWRRASGSKRSDEDRGAFLSRRMQTAQKRTSVCALRCSPVSDQKPPAATGPSWDETLEDLAQRRAAARAMGGPERLEKRKAPGRLDARERVEHLLDPGSFHEFGTLVGGDVPADGIVAGAGTIDGRPVMVGSRGLHDARRHDRWGQQRQAVPSRRARAPRSDAVRDAARRGRRPDRRSRRSLPDGPHRAVAVLGPSAGRERGDGRVGGHGALDRADVGLQRDDGRRRGVHRRSAGGEGVARRGDLEAGPRRSERGDPERADPQPRAR